MDIRPHLSTQRTAAIARVIACRYGDGAVYVPRHDARQDDLRDAIAAGFVSEDGFVTRKGRDLLARFSSLDLRG